MTDPARIRAVLIAAIVALVVCDGVLLLATHTLEPADAVRVILAELGGAAGGLLIAIGFMRSRRGPRDDDAPNLLAQWLRDIDIAGDTHARPALDVDAHDAQLVGAAEALVQRVHGYRDKLLVRHQRVQRLLRNVTDVLYHVDSGGHLTWVTDTVTDMLGYTPSELEGRALRDLLADPDIDEPALLNSAQLSRHPTRVYRRDGTIAWLLVSSRRIDDAGGQAMGSEGVCRDGTRLIETQQALNQEKERAQVTLACIGDGVIATDQTGRVEYLNPRAEYMLGVGAAEALTVDFDTLCPIVDTETGETVAGLVQACIDAGTTREWDDNLALQPSDEKNGRYAVKVTVSPMRDGDAIVGAVIVLNDISRLQRISRELAYQAHHDLLTGLPNRRAFERALSQHLEETRTHDTAHALCYLDLDQFKLVNDTCGHNAGDEMLCQITTQLAARLRDDDTIARLGGDEFGIIMRNLSLADARVKAEHLRAEIDTFRFRWSDKLFRLGVSVGVAAIDRHAASATELLRRADTACYLAKEQGRNQVHIYHGDSDEALTRHGDMQLMQQISEALDNERFVLFGQIMQPLCMQPDAPVGVELLLRMRDGDTLVEPQNVLITAERYNVAPRIDRWVLEQALTLIGDAEKDPRYRRIDHYGINISGQSISDEHFVGDARDLITRHGVDPTRLVFEITETTAVTNTRRASELIRSLRELGCRFSLDDFGSGVSSFPYLKNLPSDFIKIDGKLVARILRDPVEYSIVEAINKVGQAMGLKTIAEHVESRALLDALRRIGVDYVQGYHVARPQSFEALGQELAAPSARDPHATPRG